MVLRGMESVSRVVKRQGRGDVLCGILEVGGGAAAAAAAA